MQRYGRQRKKIPEIQITISVASDCNSLEVNNLGAFLASKMMGAIPLKMSVEINRVSALGTDNFLMLGEFGECLSY